MEGAKAAKVELHKGSDQTMRPGGVVSSTGPTQKYLKIFGLRVSLRKDGGLQIVGPFDRWRKQFHLGSILPVVLEK
jgi:hypothetical protein